MSLTPEQRRLMEGGISIGGQVGRGSTYSRPANDPVNSSPTVNAAPISPANIFNYSPFKVQPKQMPGAPYNSGPEYAKKANEQALAQRAQPSPTVTDTGGGGGGGGGMRMPAAPDLSSIFAPLFKALDQQRKTANSRYNSNVTGITNIYGQLIGARTADVATIEDAYKRLQAAASARGEDQLSGMQGREATRVGQNEALLQSLGVDEIGSTAGDVASVGSQAAQDVQQLNQGNWSGMLDTMGAASQDMARADATSYGFRQGEDIAKLQANKEDYFNQVADQEFQLKSQKAQAEQEARQAQLNAIASANASAQNARNKAEADAAKDQSRLQERQFGQTLDFLKTASPIDRAIGEGVLYGALAPDAQGNVSAAYSSWLEGAAPKMGRNGNYNPAQAFLDLDTNGISSQLSPGEASALKKAILYTFSAQ